MKLYLTADRVGAPSGGGLVTGQELRALDDALPGKTVLLFPAAEEFPSDPFAQDLLFRKAVEERAVADNYFKKLKLAHGYSGCLSETMLELSSMGVVTTYTAAAHDVELSRAEHRKLGIPFDYPHLNDPSLWEKYLAGYKAADVLICPSQHSAAVMRKYGCSRRIEVIPHGVDIPEGSAPYPRKFTVGYLGAVGPDKGLIYLLFAWKKLNFKDAALVLAGAHTTSPFVQQLVAFTGAPNVELRGWVNSPSDLYNAASLYVQPSVSEGFGCEVLEAMAHGRPVVCSTGAGASDVVPGAWKYDPFDVDELAVKIEVSRSLCGPGCDNSWQKLWVDQAAPYTWDKIRQKYTDLWRSLVP